MSANLSTLTPGQLPTYRKDLDSPVSDGLSDPADLDTLISLLQEPQLSLPTSTGPLLTHSRVDFTTPRTTEIYSIPQQVLPSVAESSIFTVVPPSGPQPLASFIPRVGQQLDLFSLLPMFPLPLTSRVGMLQLQLLEYSDDQAHTLQQEYQLTSARLETARLACLQHSYNSPWLHSLINSHYDQKHHSLINQVEHKLAAMQQNSLPTMSPIPTSCQAITGPKMSPASHQTVATQGMSPASYHQTARPVISSASPTDSTASSQLLLSSPETSPASCPAPSYTILAPSRKTCRTGQRKKLNPLAIRIMTSWYEKNQEHPYPGYEAAEVMAKAGNITVEQVKKWFANRRRHQCNTKTMTEIARRRKRCAQPCEEMDFEAKRRRE